MAEYQILTKEDDAALTAIWIHEQHEHRAGRGAHFVTLEAGLFMRLHTELHRQCMLLDPNDEDGIKRAHEDLQRYKKG